AGYSIDQKNLGKGFLEPEKLAESLLAEERWRQILSSLVVCFFARGIYKEDMVIKALNVAGFSFTTEDIHRIGESIHKDKYDFKIREGFSFDSLRIPKRIFGTRSPVDEWDEEYIRRALGYASKVLINNSSLP
ncbi:MAG: aldehyde ferredoxin oxidoreductase C-terminal domain-containing protein, partial [Halobacteriota archaeon]|nr:aldehyde ferredoxin oxidoreductase C-terminal domain-containing protein [Halobacteriota archaeon]